MLDLGLYLFYLLLGVAVLAALVFPIIHAVKAPQNLLKSLIGLGGLLVLFGLSYALSSSDVSKESLAAGITANSSKLIGAGLILFYITLALSAVAVAYSEISKALK